MGESKDDFSIDDLKRMYDEQNAPPPQIVGLPPFKFRNYKEDLPPSLNSVGTLALNNPKLRYHCGSVGCWLAEHAGVPLQLSETQTMQVGDHYIDLAISPTDHVDFQTATKLAEFVRKYPGIDWLTGTTWLASVADGKWLERLGFTISDRELPAGMEKSSVTTALSKPAQSKRYPERVKNAEVKFIFAGRNQFLASNSERVSK